MATTQLTDVVIPEIYADYQAENSPELTAFFDSGIVVRNPMLDQKANAGSDTINIPFWKDLDATDEPNIGNDNPASTATPAKITTGNQVGRMAYLNNGWSSADLSSELAGADPMQRIAARTGTYWQRQFQRRLIASCLGVLADNDANDADDMMHSIAVEDASNVSAATVFGRAAFTSAAFTLGDRFESTTAIAVHSVVYKRMIDNDDIDYIRDSEGTIVMQTFMGRRVIVDDSMPVEAGSTSGFKYTSILFGEGAFGYGEGSARVPVEIEREAAQGNGAGIETLWERKSWLLHPFGFKFVEGSVASVSPTIAEMKLAANWDRVVDRKNVGISYLVTN